MSDKPTIHKIDPETGEEIASTPEEQAAAAEAFRQALRGQFKLEFAPEARRQLKAKGLSEEEIESWLADAFDLKQ